MAKKTVEVVGSLQGDLWDLVLKRELGFLEKFLRFSGNEYWVVCEKEKEKEK
jgi:hypothetical protein